MRPLTTLLAAAAALGLTGAAHALTVNIDAKTNLSFVAGGPSNLLPGTAGQPANPVQVTLDAGTYTITNAASTGYFSGWNFNTQGNGQNTNWVWGFVMAADGGNIIEDAYTASAATSQAAIAAQVGTTTWNGNTPLAATSVAGFTDTFTLTQQTTLDFYVDDYNWGGYDNDGGVSINIQSAVPEPGAPALMVAGLAAMGLKLRRGRRGPTQA